MKKRVGQWAAGIILLAGTQSCMAPRCPIKSCHVRMEHRHEGGKAYRGTFFGTVHGPSWWLGNRKGEDMAAKYRESKRVKVKKTRWTKLPGERIE